VPRNVLIVSADTVLTDEVRARARQEHCDEIAQAVPTDNPPVDRVVFFDESRLPERADAVFCRTFVSDAALTALLAIPDGSLTNAQRDLAIKNTLRAMRALIRIVRNIP
jgi:hypothetical protein